MPVVGNAEVAIGEYLRCLTDNAEGKVTAIDGETISLQMWATLSDPSDPFSIVNDIRTATASDLYRNPPSATDLLNAQVNSLTEAIDQLILDMLMGGS